MFSKINKTSLLRRLSLNIFLCCSVILIASCGTLPQAPKTAKPSPEELSQKKPIDLQPPWATDQPRTVEHYLSLADQSTGPTRQHYLLEAVNRALLSGQLEEAKTHLAAIDTSQLNNEGWIRKALLEAQIALAFGQPQEALRHLPDPAGLSQTQQIEILETKAIALLKSGFPLDAARSRIKLDELPLALDDRERNQQLIWEALTRLPGDQLQELSQTAFDPVFKGWVELAAITKRSHVSRQSLNQELMDWRYRFSTHPAAQALVHKLPELKRGPVGIPRHIALLLPLTGRFAPLAEAVRDGFLGAYYLHEATDLRPQVTVIDIGDAPENVLLYYQEAVDKGADFVVGPLSKPAIDILTASSSLPVPVLTLNYLEQQHTLNPNLFQFGLLPEDEAQQTAEMAFHQGKRHAAVLIPNDPWGQRLAEAFRERFESLGGRVLIQQEYDPQNSDFSDPIRAFLQISDSYVRKKSLQSLLQTSLKFEPYRRHDLDFIFLGATPRAARLINPQLKFHHAADVPIYATSHIYSGNLDVHADQDINNLIYCDIPWILNESETKLAIEQQWPEQSRNFGRLFALGVDAYNVLPHLGRMQTEFTERFEGETGSLTLDQQQRIHRELLWAKFSNGQPKLLPPEQSRPETGTHGAY